MSYDSSTGIITAPISIGDVDSALNAGSLDLGTLCQNSNKINIWSKFKPVRVNKVTPLTDTDFINVRYGLRPSGSSYLNLINYQVSDFIKTNGKWKLQTRGINALLPRGGSYNEPFRLTDFNNYNHKAISPFKVSRQADGIEMYCYVQPGYQSGIGGLTNCIFSQFNNHIEYTCRITYYNEYDQDTNLDWSDLLQNGDTGGFGDYNIAILLLDANSTKTSASSLTAGTDYVILSTGIKFKWLIDDSTVQGQSAQGLSAYITAGLISIDFDYQSLGNFFNGKSEIFSKLVLVNNNFGFNNRTATITSCYGIDFDNTFVGNIYSVYTKPSLINYTFNTYIYSATVPNIYKYYGSAISNFDTVNYDYYRLTTAYASGYSYSGESNHLLSGIGLIAMTYSSSNYTINNNPTSYTPQGKITVDTNGNGYAIIRRTGSTFRTDFDSYYPLISAMTIYPNRIAGSSNTQNCSISKSSSDMSVNEIWIRVAKNKIPAVKVLIDGQLVVTCRIVS